MSMCKEHTSAVRSLSLVLRSVVTEGFGGVFARRCSSSNEGANITFRYSMTVAGGIILKTLPMALFIREHSASFSKPVCKAD